MPVWAHNTSVFLLSVMDSGGRAYSGENFSNIARMEFFERDADIAS